LLCFLLSCFFFRIKQVRIYQAPVTTSRVLKFIARALDSVNLVIRVGMGKGQDFFALFCDDQPFLSTVIISIIFIGQQLKATRHVTQNRGDGMCIIAKDP